MTEPLTREEIGLVGWQLHEGTWVEAQPLRSNIEMLRKAALEWQARAERAEAERDEYKLAMDTLIDEQEGGCVEWESLKAERDALKAEVERLKEYTSHDDTCPLSRISGGRPTTSGYETCIDGAWYLHGAWPKCTCGLLQELTNE